MRYLVEPFITGALRRGSAVEQFLGPIGSPERPGVGYEDFGQLMGTAEDPQDALVLAEECTGAARGRWVNQGVVQDEYGDFVRAGRPLDVSPDGHRWPAVSDVR